ncbi:iron-containing alcohol dehydrogenase family protein [Bacillus sp. 2205SS5-2]|uniref:iron-containing alcohol dehydrogenase family protein n=1 Tax=Bacillus sp. 2205SS5-2 TaxID=3109031 RepID=UPI003007A7C1
MNQPVTSIPIPAILEISHGAIPKLAEILMRHPFENAVILLDDFSESIFSAALNNELEINVELKTLSPELDLEGLIKEAFKMARYDVVIAIGGGRVVDFGKYIAFSRRSPFISIPTSASNDGFASSNCSLVVEGKKTTVPAKVPYGIIVDLDVIQTAPERFILAGVGDLVSNITALYDWEFEDSHGKSTVNAFAHMISKKAVNSFIRTPMNDLKNPIFLKELISSLTMGGISTAISGNSAPISGSEHLISHALEKISAKPEMHGIQVGIATYIMAHVQNHRAERINKVFQRTGFFDYVKTLSLKKAEYSRAIEIAPSIKPNRFTYLHDDGFREKALSFLETDDILQELFT